MERRKECTKSVNAAAVEVVVVVEVVVLADVVSSVNVRNQHDNRGAAQAGCIRGLRSELLRPRANNTQSTVNLSGGSEDSPAASSQQESAVESCVRRGRRLHW